MLRKRLSQVQTVVTINGCLGSAGGDITRKVRKNLKNKRILRKILQGQTIFPGLGLRTDFKPKPREDGTLDCLGAMQVIITKRYHLGLNDHATPP